MKFLLDENVDIRLAAYLTGQGHDVTAIGRDYPASLPDSTVLTIAEREARILITNDRDFGELIIRQARHHVGVLFLRLGTVDLATLIARISSVLTTHSAQLDQLIVITDRRIRVRRR
jgi:predicted nuclease of predicted toxin-antitoxin system